MIIHSCSCSYSWLLSYVTQFQKSYPMLNNKHFSILKRNNNQLQQVYKEAAWFLLVGEGIHRTLFKHFNRMTHSHKYSNSLGNWSWQCGLKKECRGTPPSQPPSDYWMNKLRPRPFIPSWNKLPIKTNSKLSGRMTETMWVQCLSGANFFFLR